MKIIIDFEKLDENVLRDIIKDVFNIEGELEEIFKELSKRFELYVISIPLPRDKKLLKHLKGFKVDPNKVCNVDERILDLVVRYCKQIKHPFLVREVYEKDGIRIIFSEDLESIVVLETNVDDVTGEVISYVVDKVLEKAIDVYVFQCIGKKGRPCTMLKVLVNEENALDIAKMLCEELPTLGVRIYRVGRFKVDRRVVKKVITIFGNEFKLRVKVSDVSIKPEFEDVKRIAEELGKPLPVVYLEILRRLEHEDSNRKQMS